MLPQSAPNSRWIVIAGLLVLFAGCFFLAVVQDPTPPAVRPPTLTSTARPGIAPPATRMSQSFMIVTPSFADSVPVARTTGFDPPQFTLGRKTYTQWCATCHGDRGQGLAEWRLTWDPDHQTCSKSNCHGRKHPEDGFEMLKLAPPLIGLNSLGAFTTAEQLFLYIRAMMPYQAPGSLSDNEYWAVTAYLADQHYANAGRQVLGKKNALAVRLR